MSFVCWTEDLTVGSAAMDAQHQVLIDIINRYHDALERGAARPELIRCFNEVAGFAVKHFGDEERLMERSQYPNLGRHKLIHQQLLSRVATLQAELAEAKPGIEQQIQFFLKSWLTAHTRGIDQQYTPYVSGRAA